MPPLAGALHDPEEVVAHFDHSEVRLVDSAYLPCGSKLLLLESEGEFSIELESEELMGTLDHDSEEALANLAALRVANLDGAVLIGGLGMGFTLGAVLDRWGPKAAITLAEVVPEILEWAQGPLAHVFGNKLADTRLTVRIADVHDVIASAASSYDAILLDVDNGPEAFVLDANRRLYSGDGLKAARSALRPGGVLAVWSSFRDEAFADRVRQAGFAVEEVCVPAYAGNEPPMHYIWFATKPA